MRIPHRATPTIHTSFLAAFVAVCLLLFGTLWVNSGGSLPLLGSSAYELTVVTPKSSNLVTQSDVTIAGVPVGKIKAIDVEGRDAHIELALDGVGVLHRGVKVAVRQKSLVQESYLELTDGKGAPLRSGTVLPAAAVTPSVGINEILRSFDAPTRAALGKALLNLGVVTDGTSRAIASALQGLGDLGRQGRGTLDALASQAVDLQQLVRNSTKVVNALNQRQGQLVSMVKSANRLTDATAARDVDIADSMRALPGLLRDAGEASGSLQVLGQNLQPVARNLRAAAPDLSAALAQLPATTADLRGLLPSLNSVLDSAPATLRRVVGASDAIDAAVPELRVDLGDLNPMLAYLQPYGRDVAAFFTGFGQALSHGTPNGKAFRMLALFNEQSVKGLPLPSTNIGAFNRYNPYPKAGGSGTPGPFTGTYPHVSR